MSSVPQGRDPLWPRASTWLRPAPSLGGLLGNGAEGEGAPHTADIGVIGIPAHLTSISPSDANATPDAVREALSRYSTFAASRGIDVGNLTALDFGDVLDPDGREGEARVRHEVGAAAGHVRFLIAIGGDNSITYSTVGGIFGGDVSACGLITLDSHHDLRDGETNGSPVRRLVDAGLPGANIVQVGIADFSNSAAYAKRARSLGITVIPRGALHGRRAADVAAKALSIAGAEGRPVFVDVDVDVCDRAEVPACHAAAPGGLSAHELREIVFALTSDARVKALDITEIDAPADSDDGRTLHLAALLILEAAAGFASRA